MTPDTCPTCCRKCERFCGHLLPCTVDRYMQPTRWACDKDCRTCEPTCPKFDPKGGDNVLATGPKRGIRV